MPKPRYSVETQGERAWLVIRIPIETSPDKIVATLGELDNMRRSELSPRENEVLDMILDRKQDKEIADALHIALRTAKYHVSRVLSKMHVSSRAELWFRNQ